jgi:hypothetical protein
MVMKQSRALVMYIVIVLSYLYLLKFCCCCLSSYAAYISPTAQVAVKSIVFAVLVIL